jgi:hypothetical protein
MLTTPHDTFVLWYILLAVFVVIPAKFLYDNAARLRPLARVIFALTAPGIFFVCMMGAFAGTSSLFDTSRNNYATFAGALIALSLAALVVLLWYRFLRIIARYPVDKLERVPVENAELRVAKSTEARTHQSMIDPATLKRPLQVLDWSFWSMLAVCVYVGLVQGSGHSPAVGATFLLVYLIALGTLVSRLEKSWITCVGLSLITGGVGLIVIYIRIHIYANDFIRSEERRAIGIL